MAGGGGGLGDWERMQGWGAGNLTICVKLDQIYSMYEYTTFGRPVTTLKRLVFFQSLPVVVILVLCRFIFFSFLCFSKIYTDLQFLI